MEWKCDFAATRDFDIFLYSCMKVLYSIQDSDQITARIDPSCTVHYGYMTRSSVYAATTVPTSSFSSFDETTKLLPPCPLQLLGERRVRKIERSRRRYGVGSTSCLSSSEDNKRNVLAGSIFCYSGVSLTARISCKSTETLCYKFYQECNEEKCLICAARRRLLQELHTCTWNIALVVFVSMHE